MDRLLFPGFSLSEAGQLYARRFEERSRNLALDFAQSRTLLALAENEGVTQQRLSELTAIASPWLVRILDRLEVMGLADRRPHPTDRRARSLAITEDAREVLPLLRNIVGESLREALTGLSTKETAILAKALHRVIANLSATHHHGGAPHDAESATAMALRQAPAAAVDRAGASLPDRRARVG